MHYLFLPLLILVSCPPALLVPLVHASPPWVLTLTGVGFLSGLRPKHIQRYDFHWSLSHLPLSHLLFSHIISQRDPSSILTFQHLLKSTTLPGLPASHDSTLSSTSSTLSSTERLALELSTTRPSTILTPSPQPFHLSSTLPHRQSCSRSYPIAATAPTVHPHKKIHDTLLGQQQFYCCFFANHPISYGTSWYPHPLGK